MIVLLPLLLIVAYLYLSYVRFYWFIGYKNLQPPEGVASFTLSNLQGKGEVKYVALGDSLSAGVGSTSKEETFVYQFAGNLSAKYSQVEVINLAWPGDTTQEVIDNQIKKAIAQNPDYITLLIGINDVHQKASTSEYQKLLSYIINELENKTSAKIIILNLPYLGSSNLVWLPFNYLLDFRTRQFNDIIATLARSDRTKRVDLYNGTYQEFQNNPSLYSSDLFHPSNEGYLLWSKLINAD